MIVLADNDCRRLAKSLPDASFDLIFADPPWGGTAHEWDRHCIGWVKHMARLLKPSGSLWLLTDMRHLMHVLPEFDGWTHVQDVVSENSNGNGPTLRPLFREVHSFGVHFRPPGSKLGGLSLRSPRNEAGSHIQRSVMRAYVPKRKYHPHQQPLEVVRSIIESACPVGGRVFEAFGGSATGAVACDELGIQCLTVENHPDNFEIAQRRLRDLKIGYTTYTDAPTFNAFFGATRHANPAPVEHQGPQRTGNPDAKSGRPVRNDVQVQLPARIRGRLRPRRDA